MKFSFSIFNVKSTSEDDTDNYQNNNAMLMDNKEFNELKTIVENAAQELYKATESDYLRKGEKEKITGHAKKLEKNQIEFENKHINTQYQTVESAINLLNNMSAETKQLINNMEKQRTGYLDQAIEKISGTKMTNFVGENDPLSHCNVARKWLIQGATQFKELYLDQPSQGVKLSQ